MENTTTTTTDVPFAGRPLPRWYDDAKFGIFIHWGPYAVPCYAPVHRDMGELVQAGDWAEVFKWSPYTEWYLNSWAIEGSPTAEHHAATYGDRTYRDFVDEFLDRSSGVSVATWTDAGIHVAYCLVTDGDAGGFDPAIPRSEIPGIRRREQTNAAAHCGVTELHFLGYPDGDRKSTRLNSSHSQQSRMPSSA